jgi:G3E family GTPase
VTVADAEHALVDLENSPIAQEQVGVADLVLVSKVDRVPATRVESVIAALNVLNPVAEVRRCAHGVVDPAEFFLDTPRRLRAHAAGGHGHRHGQLASLVVEAAGPHRLADVDAWVRTWTRRLGDDLLRVKGIVRGPRGRRTLLQAVRRTVTSERIMQADAGSWNASTFVLIGTALPTDALTSTFRALPVSGRR